MRYESLRGPIRQARKAAGLSQEALAARSGTSRITLARLEAGTDQDFRVGTLSSLLDALGLELTAAPRGRQAAQEKLLARERESGRRLELRRRHAVLAVRLLSARSPTAAALVKRARARVDVWERDDLCSAHYISRWRVILRQPLARLTTSLVHYDEWTDALFQNSPWSFALDTTP